MLDFLPNPPHKGLPTPQKWGQTWESLEKEPPGNIIVSATAGSFVGTGIGLGISTVAFSVSWPATVACIIAGYLAGTGAGLGLYGVAEKLQKKD